MDGYSPQHSNQERITYYVTQNGRNSNQNELYIRGWDPGGLRYFMFRLSKNRCRSYIQAAENGISECYAGKETVCW